MLNSQDRDAALLVAEDDDEDYLLIEKAFDRAGLQIPLHRVRDGEELLDFLLRGESAGKRAVLLLLMDLNMPRKNGRDALREIKSRPDLRRLPVVVLTTSRSLEDVALCYDLGVNSFIQKPFSFPELVDVVAALKKYWLEIVALPPPSGVRVTP